MIINSYFSLFHFYILHLKKGGLGCEPLAYPFQIRNLPRFLSTGTQAWSME